MGQRKAEEVRAAELERSVTEWSSRAIEAEGERDRLRAKRDAALSVLDRIATSPPDVPAANLRDWAFLHFFEP